MAAPKCITQNCPATSLNVVRNLETGGVAKCPYCAAHAVDKFVLPDPAAPAPAPAAAAAARVPNFGPAVPGSAPKP